MWRWARAVDLSVVGIGVGSDHGSQSMQQGRRRTGWRGQARAPSLVEPRRSGERQMTVCRNGRIAFDRTDTIETSPMRHRRSQSSIRDAEGGRRGLPCRMPLTVPEGPGRHIIFLRDYNNIISITCIMAWQEIVFASQTPTLWFHSEDNPPRAETWPISHANCKRLEAAHHRCLRRILHISWQDKVRNERVCQLTKQELLTKIREHRLRWWGHIQRMEDGRRVKQALNWIPEGTQDRSTAHHLERQHYERHRE